MCFYVAGYARYILHVITLQLHYSIVTLNVTKFKVHYAWKWGGLSHPCCTTSDGLVLDAQTLLNVHRNSSPVKGEYINWNYNSRPVKQVCVLWSKTHSYYDFSFLSNRYVLSVWVLLAIIYYHYCTLPAGFDWGTPVQSKESNWVGARESGVLYLGNVYVANTVTECSSNSIHYK